jgi:Transposase.
VPKPYPKEFREDVVRVARNREPGVTLEQIAADFGVHPITLSKWLRQMQIEISTGLLVISERTRGARDISVPKGAYLTRVSFFGRNSAREMADEAPAAALSADHDGTERYTVQMWPTT